MGRIRRTFTADYKYKIAMMALGNQKTIAEIAHEENLHENLIIRWKEQVRDFSKGAFTGKAVKAEGRKQVELQEAMLQKIGKLEVENEFLKKNFRKMNVNEPDLSLLKDL